MQQCSLRIFAKDEQLNMPEQVDHIQPLNAKELCSQKVIRSSQHLQNAEVMPGTCSGNDRITFLTAFAIPDAVGCVPLD